MPRLEFSAPDLLTRWTACTKFMIDVRMQIDEHYVKNGYEFPVPPDLVFTMKKPLGPLFVDPNVNIEQWAPLYLKEYTRRVVNLLAQRQIAMTPPTFDFSKEPWRKSLKVFCDRVVELEVKNARKS